MTATLLALLEAEGKLRLDDEIGRWLSAGPNGGLDGKPRCAWAGPGDTAARAADYALSNREGGE